MTLPFCQLVEGMSEIDDEYVWDCAPWENQRYLDFVMGISAFESDWDHFLPIDCGPHAGKFFQCEEYWEDDLEGLLGGPVDEDEADAEDLVMEWGWDDPVELGDIFFSDSEDLNESFESLREVLGRPNPDIRTAYVSEPEVTEVLPRKGGRGDCVGKTWDWRESERAVRGKSGGVIWQQQYGGDPQSQVYWNPGLGRGGGNRPLLGTLRKGCGAGLRISAPQWVQDLSELVAWEVTGTPLGIG